MNREEIEKYIAEIYGVKPDFPWMKYPDYMVFRHSDNRKWFALIMRIPKERLGLRSGGAADILNVKCDPILISSLRAEEGFYPAYHMNKSSWITALLDGSVNGEKLKFIIDMSFDLTAAK